MESAACEKVPEPAFTRDRAITRFQPEECLQFEDGGRLAVVKGTLESQLALIQLAQRAAVRLHFLILRFLFCILISGLVHFACLELKRWPTRRL